MSLQFSFGGGTYFLINIFQILKICHIVSLKLYFISEIE